MSRKDKIAYGGDEKCPERSYVSDGDGTTITFAKGIGGGRYNIIKSNYNYKMYFSKEYLGAI